MRIRRVVICLWFMLAPTILSESRQLRAADGEKQLLYVAVPGIRDYVEYGGVGILVYDIGAGHKFVKRIPTWNMPPGQAPENVKGIAASARTGKLYVSTTKRLACFDLVTEKKVWERMYEGGSDRMAISPDGTGISLMRRPEMSRRRSSSDLVRTTRSTDRTAHASILRACTLRFFLWWTPRRTRWCRRSGHSVIRFVRSPSMGARRFASSTSTSCSALKSETVKPERCCIAWKWLAIRQAPRSDMAVQATA